MAVAVLDWLATHQAAAVAILGVVMAIAATAHVLVVPRLPRSAAGWLALIWLSPILGPALYVLLGINRIVRKAASLRGEPAAQTELAAAVTEEALATRLVAAPHLVDLARAGDRVIRRALLPGNRIEPLVDGDQAFPAMLEAIAGAQRSITLLSYLFDGDEVGVRFVEALAAARGRGVEVRVLIDAAGVRYHRPRASDLLRAAGLPVALFLPIRRAFPRYWNLRNHRKVLVVDGARAFTGGVNVRRHHWLALGPPEPVHDLHFAIEGPVVAQLQQVFVDDWEFTTGEHLAGAPWFSAAAAQGDVVARVITEGPDDESDPLPWTILTALSVARRQIRVVTPYFLPDPPFVAGLEVAALRGVTVDVVIPERTNFRFVDAAVRGGLWQLQDRGVRIWRTPAPFDHAKLMTVDGEWTLLGSANWDPRSMRLNFELDLEAYSPALTARVDGLIDARIARACRFDRAELDHRSRLRRLADGAANVVQPYL